MCPAFEGEMKKTIIIFFVVFGALTAPAFGAEEAPEGLQSRIAVSLGWEHLDYDEKVDTIDSDADVTNAIVGVEGLLLLERVFFAARGIIPVITEEGDEEWFDSGALFQTNTLEYDWKRVSGMAGIALHPTINPYWGMRWSRVEQTRSDFVVRRIPFAGTFVEKIKSLSAVFGVRGEGGGEAPLRAMYAFEYYHPLDVEVTNTAFPGVEFTDEEGYGWEFRGEIQYAFKERLLVGLHFFGGRMHWDGSGWMPDGTGRLVKWPENDTVYLGAGASLNWFF
jgi:hypothetical protein